MTVRAPIAKRAGRARERARVAERLAADPIGRPAGELPPMDLAAERAIVAVALEGDGGAARYLAQPARARHFYSEAHRRTVEAVEALASKGAPATLPAIVAHLTHVSRRLAQVGGLAALRAIVVGEIWRTSAQIERAGAAVVDAWKRRAHMDGMRRGAALLRLGAPRFEVARAVDEWIRAVEADGPELEAARGALEALAAPVVVGMPRTASVDYTRAARAAAGGSR